MNDLQHEGYVVCVEVIFEVGLKTAIPHPVMTHPVLISQTLFLYTYMYIPFYALGITLTNDGIMLIVHS